MAKGVFTVAADPPTGSEARDIDFCVDQSRIGADIPEEQYALRDEIDQTLTVLRILFPSGDSRFREYFVPLLALAQTGLVGDFAQPALAVRALSSLKAEIVAREAGQVKNAYMRRLGWTALLFAVPAIAAAVWLSSFHHDLLMLSNFLLLWAGCMVGVWLSFGARKTVLRFEELHVLEQDRLEPAIRLLFAGLLTLLLGLLFHLKVLEVNFGGASSSALADNWEIALVVGALAGFSEQLLSPAITKQASALIKA